MSTLNIPLLYRRSYLSLNYTRLPPGPQRLKLPMSKTDFQGPCDVRAIEVRLYFSDIGVMDEEGYCTICGRIKDIIIRGGENINPLEVEQILYTHPKIKDVQVGVKHTAVNCVYIHTYMGRPRWLSWMRHPTGDQEVAGSTPAEVGNILSWRLIMKYFLRSFSPFR